MRTCGGCTLCCKVPSIDLEDGTVSPAQSWCRHCAIGKGCGIYETRPKVCEIFKCLWLLGAFRDEDRPDRVRILSQLRVEALVPDDKPIVKGGEMEPVRVLIYDLVESTPGAFETERGQYLLRQAAITQYARKEGRDFPPDVVQVTRPPIRVRTFDNQVRMAFHPDPNVAPRDWHWTEIQSLSPERMAEIDAMFADEVGAG